MRWELRPGSKLHARAIASGVMCNCVQNVVVKRKMAKCDKAIKDVKDKQFPRIFKIEAMLTKPLSVTTESMGGFHNTKLTVTFCDPNFGVL